MQVSKYLLVLMLYNCMIASCKPGKESSSTEALQAVSSSRQQGIDSFPESMGYINDVAFVFTPEETNRLDSLLLDCENSTTIQIAVITIDSTLTDSDHMEDFTLKIANHWGVGHKGKSNGVLVGVSKQFRKIRIENGNGIEKILTDAETKNIIDTAFLPGYREADYFKGTFSGLSALVAILRQRYKDLPG